MATAIYCRVSSRTQTEASQLPDLERWSQVQGNAAEVDWYRDQYTGRTLDRPGWNKVWAGVLGGRYDRIVVWRIDRLGRSMRELSTLFEEFTRRKVTLVSLREGFDLASPGGMLFANMLGAFSQYETEVRSERQLAGIAAARARGVRFGRRPGEGGRPGKRLKVTPEQSEQVRALKSLGRPIAVIARAVGLSRPTVYSVLDEPD